MKIPTVKISDGNNGFVIINESDFDEKKHELFEEKPAEIELVTKAEAENWNRDQLRDYAKPFGITGRSTDEFLSKLEEAGKFAQPVAD